MPKHPRSASLAFAGLFAAAFVANCPALAQSNPPAATQGPSSGEGGGAKASGGAASVARTAPQRTGAGDAGPQGQTPLLPELTPGTAGSSKVPVPGSVPNAATADYPTDATADYVFACMSSNGNTRSALEQCSCSFDVVATLLPYDRYTEASTFLSMGQVAGEKGALFRSSEEAKAAVGDLRRAQAEAEVRCFD